MRQVAVAAGQLANEAICCGSWQMRQASSRASNLALHSFVKRTEYTILYCNAQFAHERMNTTQLV